MKLIIQIPCYNEKDTLPFTLADLPRQVEGFDSIEWLVVDDGSTDGTPEVARSLGVDHIVSLPHNRGLARAFAAGLDASLRLGADVIVNTDGDNQYRGAGVADLVVPILRGEAEIVVGDRRTASIPHFSPMKKWLQRLGSRVVSWTAGIDVPDATSGFRAMSREAALRTNVFGTYTYTLETIIQAGKKGIPIVSVPVETNPMLRESRLIRSIPRYVSRSASMILRIFLMYEPLRSFFLLGSILLLLGSALVVRFLYFFALGEGQGHVQSLLLASILIVISFLVYLLGLLGDLVARNRHLSEEILYRLRRQELGRGL